MPVCLKSPIAISPITFSPIPEPVISLATLPAFYAAQDPKVRRMKNLLTNPRWLLLDRSSSFILALLAGHGQMTAEWMRLSSAEVSKTEMLRGYHSWRRRRNPPEFFGLCVGELPGTSEKVDVMDWSAIVSSYMEQL
jgi:hypothetical protein